MPAEYVMLVPPIRVTRVIVPPLHVVPTSVKNVVTALCVHVPSLPKLRVVGVVSETENAEHGKIVSGVAMANVFSAASNDCTQFAEQTDAFCERFAFIRTVYLPSAGSNTPNSANNAFD